MNTGSDVNVIPNAEFSNAELPDPEYVKSIEVQGSNLYKLHVAGEDAIGLFPLDTDSRPHTALAPLLHSRPTTSFTEDEDAGLHSRLDENDTLQAVEGLSNRSKAIVFSAFGKLAPQMNAKLADEASFSTNHGRQRRGGVSGRSTNTVLNSDGTFITNVDSEYQMEVEVAKSVMIVDKRNVDEKVKAAVGDLVYPPGLRAKTPGKHKSDTELDKRLVGMPGGLHLSKTETAKYFGPESRVKFFERNKFIKNQRIIASTDALHETKTLLFDGEKAGGNINSDHNVKNQLDRDFNGDTAINALAADIPFYPMRVDNSVKVNTKVVIRTQSLDVTSDEFTQLKLVPKPANCEILEEEPPSPAPAATGAKSTSLPSSPKKQTSFATPVPHHKHPSDQYDNSIKNIDETMRAINFEMTTNTITRLLSIGPPPTPNLVIKKPFSLLDPITPREVTPVTSKPATIAATPSKPLPTPVVAQRRSSKAVKVDAPNSMVSNTTSATTSNNTSSNNSVGGAATPTTSTSTKSNKGNTGKGGRKAMVQLTPLKLKNSTGTTSGRKSPELNKTEGVTSAENGSTASESKSDSAPAAGSVAAAADVKGASAGGSDAANAGAAASAKEQKHHHLHLHEQGYHEHHSIHQTQGPLEFIVIDHRDNRNQPLKKRSYTNSGEENTLYKYVSERQAQAMDFVNVDKEEDSDDDLLTKENIAQPPVANEDVPLSPRSHYIDSCIRKRLNPRASLILRRKFTKQLSLQHHGIGDEMMCLFADAIINIPCIQSLNLADNNLTDKSLGPIVLAVVKMKELIDLNISFNTIGPVAATSLAHYLSDPNCPLERLVLRRADIDDGECERFVTALKTNTHLKELDLSENLIGVSENLNSVMPDIVTGGEALADLLRSGGCVLTSLKLGTMIIE